MRTKVRSPLVAVATGRLRPVWPILVLTAAAVTLVALLSWLMPENEVPLILVHLVALMTAAGAAYLLDDPAAQVTGVVPRSLVRRRLVPVTLGLLVLALGWGAALLMLEGGSPSLPLTALTWEVSGLFWVAVAAAAVVSRHGESEPGNLVAPALGLGFVGVLLTQPVLHLTLLVSSEEDPSRAGWWALSILASAATLVGASRDRAGRPGRPGLQP